MEKKRTKKTNRKRKIKKIKVKTRRNTICRAPPRRRNGQHLKKNELEKKKRREKKKTACKQRKQRTMGKNYKERGKKRQTIAQSTLQVAVAVCGTTSIARFSLLVRLIPCYPDFRLSPAFVK